MPKQIIAVRDIHGYDQDGKPVKIPNFDSYKGIYAIGLDEPIHEEDTIVKSKIGLGGLNNEKDGGLLQRIRSYYTAFPDGVWEYAFLISKRKRVPKGWLGEIEREVHQLLDERKTRYETQYTKAYAKRLPEWFKCKIKVIRWVFKKVQQKYPTLLEAVFPSEHEEAGFRVI